MKTVSEWDMLSYVISKRRVIIGKVGSRFGHVLWVITTGNASVINLPHRGVGSIMYYNMYKRHSLRIGLCRAEYYRIGEDRKSFGKVAYN